MLRFLLFVIFLHPVIACGISDSEMIHYTRIGSFTAKSTLTKEQIEEHKNKLLAASTADEVSKSMSDLKTYDISSSPFILGEDFLHTTHHYVRTYIGGSVPSPDQDGALAVAAYTSIILAHYSFCGFVHQKLDMQTLELSIQYARACLYDYLTSINNPDRLFVVLGKKKTVIARKDFDTDLAWLQMPIYN